MIRQARLIICIAMSVLALSGPIRAQQAGAMDAYAEASSWTIGIMTGTLRETAADMANDMALALNDGPDMRIVPMIGESSIQNVTDLFYLDSVDAAIVQSDVLTHLRRTRGLPGIGDDIQYIGKLHSAEFHVLSRMNYRCLADLAGRKVNFGPAGSGSSLTSQAVFEANKVEVQPYYLAHAIAAERLRKGELDAVAFVSGKPSGAFERIHYTDGVHFLDVEFSRDLQRDYLPAIMTHDDYPDLIARDETVSTIAVSAVLAVKKTPAGSEPYAKLERFVDRLFSEIDRFSAPPNHVKWREVALSAPVNGWTRFPAALQWLKTHPDSAAARAGNPQRP
jgi:TRAP transporter TAXI family solute receptor